MSINDADLKAIMATFKSFDADGDNSLSKDELSNILYRISKGQSFEEIDQEVEDIMEACDKDKSGQISYVEFFSTQKKHDFGEKAKAALEKLTKFMALEEAEKKQIITENNEHFSQLLREKENAIQKEKTERDLEEAEQRRREEQHAQHLPHYHSPKIESVHDEIKTEPAEKSPILDGKPTIDHEKDQEIQTLKADLANQRTEHVKAIGELEANSNTIQRELMAKLSTSEQNIKQVENDRAKQIRELEQSLQQTTKDLEDSRAINERITMENKTFKEIDKSQGDALRQKVREQEVTIAELRSLLDLARLENPDKDSDEELSNARLALSEQKDEKAKTDEKLQKAEADIAALQEQMEKSAHTYSQKLHEEKVSRSNEEVEHRKEMDAKKKQISDLQTQQGVAQREIDSLKQLMQQLKSEVEEEKAKGKEGQETQLEINTLRQKVAQLEKDKSSLMNLLEGEKGRIKEKERENQENVRKSAYAMRQAEQQRDVARERESELEKALHDNAESIRQKDDQLDELRKEMKQMQLQNLKMSAENNAHPPPRNSEEDNASIMQALNAQRSLRDELRAYKRTSKFFNLFYFLWVLIVLGVAIAWTPGIRKYESDIYPSK